MKPVTVGRISPVVLKTPIRYPDSWSDGDIEYERFLYPAHAICQEMTALLTGRYRVSKSPHGDIGGYITVVNGSAYVHTDPDFGLMAIALIDNQSLDEPELVTCHGGLRMMLGDVVVFNGDKWHAWIAHQPCALATLCVSRVRRTTTKQKKAK